MLDRLLPCGQMTSRGRQGGVGGADWKADTQPLHKSLEELRQKILARCKISPTAGSIAHSWNGILPRCQRSSRHGRKERWQRDCEIYPHFVKGLIDRMTGDDDKARSDFAAARLEQEKVVLAHPEDAGALGVLGLIDAALKRKEEALREGRHALELLPLEEDVISGGRIVVCLARIAAWVGDNSLACEQLARSGELPTGVSYGDLKLSPFWDPLRGDPCFEKIVASLAPKG